LRQTVQMEGFASAMPASMRTTEKPMQDLAGSFGVHHGVIPKCDSAKRRPAPNMQRNGIVPLLVRRVQARRKVSMTPGGAHLKH